MTLALLLQRARKHPLPYLLRRTLDEIYEFIATAFWTFRFRTQCLLKGIKVGDQVEVFGPVVIRAPGANITIGNKVQLISSSWRCSFASITSPVRFRTFLPSARIILEDGSGFGGGSVTARSQTIRIGKKAAFGSDCILSDSDFHVAWPPEQREHYETTDHDKGIDIGENVWVGARSIILKGVSIGDNSVVAAGSVVSTNIPANCFAAGNPARVMMRYERKEDMPKDLKTPG